jgi:hypothetical protein
MSKTIIVKLTKAGLRTGPFTISDNYGNVLATDVSKRRLIQGMTFNVDTNVSVIILESTGGCIGKCKNKINISIGTMNAAQLATTTFQNKNTPSLWRHLTNPRIYNTFYGNIEPYIIEYPFSYEYYDEILQNVKDYTKAYKYLDIPDGVFNYNTRIETDDRWFNKAILYNDQQSTGILELVPKPMHNLKEYLKFPIYNPDSKTITYTKSDNFYQYNTFWSLVKNKSIPLFTTTCCNALSLDKTVNQANMDYGKRSFKKEPLRAKLLKVRHILDNRDDAHLSSRFITTPSQISYK